MGGCLRRLREPYRTLSVFILGVLFGMAFDALWDLIVPPHHIRWSHNITHVPVIVAGVLLLLRFTHWPKNPNK